MPYERSSAASEVSLACFGARFIRAKQSLAARIAVTEYVAKRKPALDEAVPLRALARLPVAWR